MWPRSPILWFNSNFWIYVDSGILIWFGPNFWANTDSHIYRFWYGSPILDSHIPLLGNKFEFQFFDLNQILGPNPTLEPKFDLSQFCESALVHIPFILEPKLTTILNHFPYQGIDSYDSLMIFENWSYNRDKFHVKILHDPIHIGEYNNVNKKEVIKGGFLDNPW